MIKLWPKPVSSMYHTLTYSSFSWFGITVGAERMLGKAKRQSVHQVGAEPGSGSSVWVWRRWWGGGRGLSSFDSYLKAPLPILFSSFIIFVSYTCMRFPIGLYKKIEFASFNYLPNQWWMVKIILNLLDLIRLIVFVLVNA